MPHAPSEMDLLVVARDHDVKLLQHLLNSIELFMIFKGDINIVLSRCDFYLLEDIELPQNVVIHEKEALNGLGDDGYANQMFIKLHADLFSKTEWILIVDADFLFVRPTLITDFFSPTGRPYWFFDDWDPCSQLKWCSPTERLLGRSVRANFMARSQWILNRSWLREFRQCIDITRLPFMHPPPSEFIAYGAFAFDHHNDGYEWVRVSSADSPKAIVACVNQRPPDYLQLDDAIDVRVFFEEARILQWWSHWDEAERMMREALANRRREIFGDVGLEQTPKTVRKILTMADLLRNGPSSWDGCYSDGWIKKLSTFTVFAENPFFISLKIQSPGAIASKSRRIICQLASKTIEFQMTENFEINLPFRSDCERTDVAIHVIGEGLIESNTGRKLYGRFANYQNLLVRSDLELPKFSIKEIP